LERYLLTWLSAENLNEFYESFSLLRDEKAAAILPKLAADLGPILFAISIDVPELNVASNKSPTSKTEPIIAVPNSSNIIKTSTGKHRRNIDEFEETVKANEVPSPSAFTFEASPPYEAAAESVFPTFSDKISIISSESSPSSFNLKDDDTISHSSSTSSDDEFSTPKTSSGEPEASINTLNQIDNEVMMQKQRERIMELENQVLELTLENSRLKKLLNSSKVNTLANLQISIPRAVLQKTKTKNFYLYEINLRSKDGSESWTIFKRYRDFHTLHKQLRKQHLQIKILDFPPKKKIGNLDFDFVEERRQRLQVYMRHVLQNLPELANCDSRKFLEAKCSFFKT
jgi:sorting nexin-29